MQSTNVQTLPETRSRSLSLALPAFAAALFLSALLLFSVQPMFTKMALPQLGGSPGVWSVAMVFFQGLLLLGYLWAHFLARRLPLWLAAALHLSICALVFVALPIAAASMPPPPAEGTGALAHRPVRAERRPAVLRAVGERSAPAGVVRAHRPCAGGRSLLSVRRLQPRLLRRAARLSVPHRAAVRPVRPEPHLDVRLRGAGLALCACAAIALAARPRFESVRDVALRARSARAACRALARRLRDVDRARLRALRACWSR